MLHHKMVLASHNVGKIQELQSLLGTSSWQVIPISHYSQSAVAETGLTFVENALIKARHAAQISQLPALGDDSGLIVDALNGAPGIYSARYAGENANAQQHINKLLTALVNFTPQQRTARFYCVLVYLRHAEDPCPIIAEACWEGNILTQVQGEKGFGYDPIFYVPTHQCSAAELPSAIKNQLSHRGQALKILLEKLQNLEYSLTNYK